MPRSTAEEVAREVSSKIMDDINRWATSPLHIAEALQGHHRTLQQSFTRVVIEYLKLQAQDYEDGHYDLRNEETCKWAHRLREEGLLDVGLPYI